MLKTDNTPQPRGKSRRKPSTPQPAARDPYADLIPAYVARVQRRADVAKTRLGYFKREEAKSDSDGDYQNGETYRKAVDRATEAQTLAKGRIKRLERGPATVKEKKVREVKYCIRVLSGEEYSTSARMARHAILTLKEKGDAETIARKMILAKEKGEIPNTVLQ